MKVRFVIPSAVFFSVVLAASLQAEPFVDLYGGWSKARNSDVSAFQRTCYAVGCTALTQTTEHQAFESDATAGVRAGYWFERHPWFGMAGDLSYSHTASTQLQLDAISVAATPMLRLPLWTTSGRPRGHLQPYIGTGPTIVMHQVQADFQPSTPVNVSGWSMAVGWTARAGLAVPVSDHVAFFGEWRLSQERVSVRETGFFGLGDQGRLDLTQTMQQSMFGLSYRF